MMIKHSLPLLQKAMNKALHLDGAMPEKLRRLEGKCLQICITPLQVQFFMTFEGGEIVLLEQADSPDTVIESSPLGLIRLSLLPLSRARSLFHDEVRFSGDTELGQQVKQLFDELDIDWEGHLARFTGDVVAHQVGSFIRRGRAMKQELTQSLCTNVSEYLHEELRHFPPAEELNDFFADVDTLVDDTERLAAQIHFLITNLKDSK
jgi:ubiquinone biosynthesis protein UbiJ